MGDTVSEFMHASEEGCPGGRAGRADVKIIETHAFSPQAVCVGSLEVGMPVGVDIPIALVIGEDEDDAWFFGECRPLAK